jgi:Reverse transcriptase (RNA-dependent DNA polymerase)
MAFRLALATLDLALDHLESQGDSDILPPAFEIAAIRHAWSELGPRLADTDLDTWHVGPRRQCLAPKQRLGLRIATQLDPLDSLLTTGLVIEAGQRLENTRIGRDEGVVHSHRFELGLGHGRLFSPAFSFRSFRERSLELVDEGAEYVLLTDISDFYPRLYHHRVENALRSALEPDTGPARVILKFLNQWSQSISYGLPVGAAAFRLIAEVTLDDVDQALAAEGYTFCRYSDDYRVFVDSERDARAALAFLAQILAVNHGLTLQEAKTEILPAQTFRDRFRWSEQDQATTSLQENLYELLQQVGIDTYDLPDFDSLPEELIAEIEQANVWQLLAEQLRLDRPDARTVRFALQQIVWWGLHDEDGIILDGIAELAALFPEAIRGATASHELDLNEMQSVGKRLLELVDHPTFAHLEYFRAWILSVFAESPDWNHSPQLQNIHRQHTDSFTRSAATRALGVSGIDHWFRSRRGDLFLMDPWERRAFLAGAASLPSDERRHWYASVRQRLSPLEVAVVDWAKEVPQGTRRAVSATEVDFTNEIVDDAHAGDADIPF